MNTIKTKFKAGQTVWLASIREGSIIKTRIFCISIKDYGDKTNIEYEVRSNWFEEEPDEFTGLFGSRQEAEKFLLQGSVTFKELQKKNALDRVKFQEEQLAKAKADLEAISYFLDNGGLKKS